MGFDLSARNRRLGRKGYFRASVYQMMLLRRSMTCAGVDQRLVYHKFVGNDGFFVTKLQARKVAEKLSAWLRGRNLTVELVEDNNAARKANSAYLGVFQEIGDGETRSIARRFSKAKSLPVRLDSGMRAFIRTFAKFCDRSDGFWVE